MRITYDVELAKFACEKAYGDTKTKRVWEHAALNEGPDPVNVYVLSGSPAKGIVIDTGARGPIRAYDAWGKKLYFSKSLVRNFMRHKREMSE